MNRFSIMYAFCFALLSCMLLRAGIPEDRARAMKLYNEGNYKEAYEIFKSYLLSEDSSSSLIGNDLSLAVSCLQSINEVDKLDDFLEKAIEAHQEDWKFLSYAAQQYLGIQKQGVLLAGEFKRGTHRGGGDWHNVWERDRVRSQQLYARAVKLAEENANATDKANLFLQYAQTVMQYRGSLASWRLQYLTDLSVLPDPEPGYGHYWGGNPQGAPVDEDGNPVYYRMPKSFEEARNDGERWRWLLMMAAEYNPGMSDQIAKQFADFLYQQFGVQTLQAYGHYFYRDQTADQDTNDAVYSLHTLKNNENVINSQILFENIRRYVVANADQTPERAMVHKTGHDGGDFLFFPK